MTSELPEQLRELADSLDCCQWNHPITGVRTCVEAAQEIERLRAEQSPITDWRVRLVRPEPGEPFGTHVECRVIDISYSDKVLLVKEAGG